MPDVFSAITTIKYTRVVDDWPIIPLILQNRNVENSYTCVKLMLVSTRGNY